jgi:hypothetical protein
MASSSIQIGCEELARRGQVQDFPRRLVMVVAFLPWTFAAAALLGQVSVIAAVPFFIVVGTIGVYVVTFLVTGDRSGSGRGRWGDLIILVGLPFAILEGRAAILYPHGRLVFVTGLLVAGVVFAAEIVIAL